MDTYPDKLPPFLATHYGYINNDSVDRTVVNGGYESAHLRTRHSGAVFQVSSRMTYSQLMIFEGFWAYRLSGGFDWFLIGLDVGTGIQEHTARFAGATYNAEKDGPNHWIVSARIEVEAKADSGYTRDATIFISTGGNYDELLHELVHVTLPGIWGGA